MATTQRILSCYNSTTTALGAGQTWTGTWEEVLDYKSITTYVDTDVPSAAGGLQLYFSSNTTGANEVIYKYTNYAGQQEYRVPTGARYFRIVYVNDGTNQGEFALKTYLIRTGDPVPEPIVFNPGQVDLFGRLRVSEPVTLLDVKHLYTFNTLQMDRYTSGTGAITYNSNAATVSLTVGASTGKSIIQSRLYCQYQPGKSLLVYATGILNNGAPNDSGSVARIGYFDENNGPFFEYSAGVARVVLRNNAVDTSVAQSAWNIDAMDGLGISRVTVDWTKALIYVINVAWLGVGQIIMGVIWGGQFYPVHIFRNTTLTSTYMGSPNLPVRYELSGINSSLLSICASITSEGGYSLPGVPFSVGLGSAKSVTVAETYLFSVRLKTNRRSIVKLLSASFLATTTDDYVFRVYTILSPSTVPVSVTLPAVLTWNSVNANSSMEYNTDGTTMDLTNAILVYEEFISGSMTAAKVSLRQDSETVFVTAGINQGAFYSDYVICTAQRTTVGTKSVFASLTWTETF